MPRHAVRLVTYAWGKSYIDKLLDFTLASVLSPRNLPLLAEMCDCTLVVVTEQAWFDYVRAHPLVKRLELICVLRLVPLDDLVAESWQYGITLAHALFRGFADLGSAMTDTYMLFLNADFVLADGSYERLIPYMEAGHRAILAPSYCAVEERVRPVLRARAAQNDGLITLPPREMAALILANRHNTIRAKTINQDLFHFEYTDQFYWAFDEDTLLAHQMPISLVALRPERALEEISSFWDWGIVYDFCPSKELTVLGDSDNFLMLELRDDKTHIDLVRPGPGTPRAAAARMTGYITQYQVDNTRFPLTLHAGALPRNLDAARTALWTFAMEVLSHLPTTPIDHRNHAQWLYHKRHLELYQWTRPLRAKLAQARTALAALEQECDQRRAAIERDHQLSLDRLSDAYEPRFETLRHDLSALELALRLEAGNRDVPVLSPVAPLRSGKGALARQLLRFIVGYSRLWHPLRLVIAPVLRAVKEAQRTKSARVLLVCRSTDILLRAVPAADGTISPENLLEAAGAAGWDDMPHFDLCVVQLAAGDLPHAGEFYNAILPRMRKEGKVVLLWINFGLLPPDLWQRDLAKALLVRAPRIRVSFTGTRVGASALRVLGWSKRHRRSRVFGMAARIAGPPTSMVLAMVANLSNQTRGDGEVSNCTAACIEIDVERTPPQPTPDMVAALDPASESVDRAPSEVFVPGRTGAPELG
jgi:hypothetical protein